MVSETITIRDYRESDATDVVSLLREGYESDITPEVLKREYVGSERNIIVAQDTSTGKVVGCFFWEIQKDFVRKSRVLFLTYLIVDMNYRRRGIARSLCLKMEDIAKLHNCGNVELTSANYRTDAHELYKSIGYTVKKTSVFIKEL